MNELRCTSRPSMTRWSSLYRKIPLGVEYGRWLLKNQKKSCGLKIFRVCAVRGGGCCFRYSPTYIVQFMVRTPPRVPMEMNLNLNLNLRHELNPLSRPFEVVLENDGYN